MLDQTQERTDGRIFMDGFYAADHDFTGAHAECNLATGVNTQKICEDLGSVT